MRLLKYLYAVTLLVLCITRLAAQNIAEIEQMIFINEDGSAEIRYDIQVDFTDSTRSLMVPSEYVDLSDTRVLVAGGNTSASALLAFERTSPVYDIQFESAVIGANRISLTSQIPGFLDWDAAGPEEFDAYQWAVTYTNTIPGTIGECALTVILPQGWNYHRIEGSDPEFKKKEPKPPYSFRKIEGRASISIARSPMKYMEKVSINFTYKNEEKPKILIWVGVFMSILYLYYFRELILRRDSKQDIDMTNKELK